MKDKTFNFAGFTWPRRVVELPKGTPRSRLDDKRTRSATYDPRVSSPYHAPKPRKPHDWGHGFYHGDAGMPGLRWQWADDIAPRAIDHRGWFTDDDIQDDTMRGIVFRLPQQQGFLYGWSMGEGMIAEITGYEPIGEYDPSRYGDAIEQAEHSAALAADDAAKWAAEKERTYNACWRAGEEYVDCLQTAENERAAYRQLARVIQNAIAKGAPTDPVLCDELRSAFERHVKAERDALSRARELRENAPTWNDTYRDAWNDGAGQKVLT